MLQDTEGYTQLAMNQGAQDEGIYAEFYMYPQQNQAKSAAENRPIFDDIAFIRIMVPGNKSSIIERPVRLGPSKAHDNNRFAQQYAMFEANKDEVLEGTPLSEWPAISRSQALELQHFHVKTVEQLATMSDTNAQNFSAILHLRDQAKRFLSDAKEGAQVSQMQDELSKRDDVVTGLQAQIDELVKELGSKKKK